MSEVVFSSSQRSAFPLRLDLPGCSSFDVQDFLVYDYDLNLVTSMESLKGIPEDEVVLHIMERDNVFYVLTNVKTEEYDWAKFRAVRSIAPPNIDASYQDDKYGFCFSSMKLYSYNASLYTEPSLIYEVPWGTHSSADTLIQEVTDKHVWLNWSAVDKARSGSCLGLGIRLDGSGYDEVPGLIAIMYGHYVEDKWFLLCYKNISTRVGSGIASGADWLFNDAGRFPRWGDGLRSELLVVDGDTLELHKHDNVYHPSAEWFYMNTEDNETLSGLDRKAAYSGGPQPGYSQVVKRRVYDWVYTDVLLRKTATSLKPTTWIKTTTGGPNMVIL